MKLKLVLISLLCTSLLTGCTDKSQINVFDYSHKEAVPYNNNGDNSQIKDILRNILTEDTEE